MFIRQNEITDTDQSKGKIIVHTSASVLNSGDLSSYCNCPEKNHISTNLGLKHIYKKNAVFLYLWGDYFFKIQGYHSFKIIKTLQYL